VDVLEGRGEVIWLAVMWTRYERPSARVESCANDSRALIELKLHDFSDWLEPRTPQVHLERWLQPFGLYKNARVEGVVAKALYGARVF
jgi:hypothetical protein